jgi:hypothetical protein
MNTKINLRGNIMKKSSYTSCLTSTNYEGVINITDKFFESAYEDMSYVVDKLNCDCVCDCEVVCDCGCECGGNLVIGKNKKTFCAMQIQSLKDDLRKMRINITLKKLRPSKDHLAYFDAKNFFVIRVKLSNTNLQNKSSLPTPLASIKSLMSTKVEEFKATSLHTNRFGKIKPSNKKVLEEVIRYINALNRAFYVEYELYSYLLWLSHKSILEDDSDD